MRLEKQGAIVTGAAVGIGRAIAVALGREGASVAVNCSKSHEEAEETARLVREAGGKALVVQADISQDQQVRTMVAATLESFGRIDLLVNNAGITVHVPFADLESMTEDAWDRIYGVNVKGTFFCCRAVVEPMRRQGHGRIINIASVSGMRAVGSSLAYSSSKAAVIHLSKCLARTLGPEIQVNVIAPGTIAGTRWNSGLPNLDERQARAAEDSVLKRVGSPEEIAEAVLFLATRASYVTGAILVVDGGLALS